MTRKSKREIGRSLDDLGGGGENPDEQMPQLVSEDTQTGEWYVDRDEDADPVDKDTIEQTYPTVIVYPTDTDQWEVAEE